MYAVMIQVFGPTYIIYVYTYVRIYIIGKHNTYIKHIIELPCTCRMYILYEHWMDCDDHVMTM